MNLHLLVPNLKKVLRYSCGCLFSFIEKHTTKNAIVLIKAIAHRESEKRKMFERAAKILPYTCFGGFLVYLTIVSSQVKNNYFPFASISVAGISFCALVSRKEI